MIIIFNNTNSLKGGSLQVALSYLREIKKITVHDYHVFVGREIISQINTLEFPDYFHFYLFKHQVTSIRYRFYTIRLLNNLAKRINPDCIITPFGPSYWTPVYPHLVGFGRGYYLYHDAPFFGKIGILLTIRIKLLERIHKYFFKKNSDYFYVETEDAKKRLSLFLGNEACRIHVLPNTYHPVFNLPVDSDWYFLPEKADNEYRLLTISAYYPHKNLEIISAVISILNKKSHHNFKFILTLDQRIFSKKFRCPGNNIINLGPIPIEKCPKLYYESDFMFLPSLIEIFSAAYPEAMRMKKPILTSDTAFAREICGDAAAYFDPLNPEIIADTIIKVTENQDFRKMLIQNGVNRLNHFVTSEMRTRNLLSICAGIKGDGKR